MANNLLKEEQFSEGIILNLKKSGTNFLYSGLISLAIVLLVFITKIFESKIEFVFDSDLIVPFFLMIIGIFLIIQSDVLSMAKGIQEENDLTI